MKHLLLVAAPSGAGKNSFMVRALRDFSQLKDVPTYTTRHPRSNEKDGVDYHFISSDRFSSLIEEGFFAEWARVHDQFYGVSHQSLEDCWAEGRVAIMDVDIQGVATLKANYPQARSIFIMPPSIEELKVRILARDVRAPANLELRLENARKEIAKANEFDYQVINDDLEKSYKRFKLIVEKILGNALT